MFVGGCTLISNTSRVCKHIQITVHMASLFAPRTYARLVIY